MRRANCIRTYSPGSGCGAGPRRVQPFADSGEVTCTYAKLAEAEAPPRGPSRSACAARWGSARSIPRGRGPWRRDFCAGCLVCRHGVGADVDARIGRRGGGRRAWAGPGRAGKWCDGGTEGPRRKSREPPVSESVGDPGITVCDRTDLDCCRAGHRRRGHRREGCRRGARRPGHRRAGHRRPASPCGASRRSGSAGIPAGVAEPVIRLADHMTEAPRMARGLAVRAPPGTRTPDPLIKSQLL